MVRTAECSNADKESRKVIRDAADDPFMWEVMMNLGMVPINLPPEPRLAVPAVLSDPFDA
jgi:hypothetical protein